MGTAAPGSVENREKHQGNEYIKDLGLNWMAFGARQYDPQIGRFLGVDPLADYYGQDRYSPYAAMGNQPESMVDPNGLAYRDVFKSMSALPLLYENDRVIFSRLDRDDPMAGGTLGVGGGGGG